MKKKTRAVKVQAKDISMHPSLPNVIVSKTHLGWRTPLRSSH